MCRGGYVGGIHRGIYRGGYVGGRGGICRLSSQLIKGIQSGKGDTKCCLSHIAKDQ